MSSTRPNSTTLYLRPIEYQQPYQIRNAANMLVKQGQFNCVINATNWLVNLEESNSWKFKHIMDKYYELTDYKTDYKNTYDINTYMSNNHNAYGEEPHMWY